MELLRELMRKAERNQMMTQTMSLHQLEHKHAPDPRQAEWNAQKAAGQWPGWKATAPPPKSVNPPASSGRPPKMNYDPNDDPWAAEGVVPKADPPTLQIFGNVHQGTPPINLPPAATAKSGFPEHSAAAMGRPLPAGQALGAVARRRSPSVMALLFRCGERAVCEPWRLEDRNTTKSTKTKRRHANPPARFAFRHRGKTAKQNKKRGQSPNKMRKLRLTTTSRVRARRPTLGVRAAPAMPIKLAKTRKQTKLKFRNLTSLNLTFFSQHTKKLVKCLWLCPSHCAVSLALLFCC